MYDYKNFIVRCNECNSIQINENYQSHLQVGVEASVAVWMYNCIIDLLCISRLEVLNWNLMNSKQRKCYQMRTWYIATGIEL